METFILAQLGHLIIIGNKKNLSILVIMYKIYILYYLY